jgi:hypothetical protein
MSHTSDPNVGINGGADDIVTASAIAPATAAVSLLFSPAATVVVRASFLSDFR